MAIHDDLMYETDENGERVIVKSVESVRRAYLRFSNRTSRPVNIWWRDFQGVKRHYVRLDPGAYYDINSYLTHPWEFTDVSTKERYVINNQYVFRAPSNIGGMNYRTNWNINVSVRSLRSTAMLALAELLQNAEDAHRLDLPSVLAADLYKLINTLRDVTPSIEN